MRKNILKSPYDVFPKPVIPVLIPRNKLVNSFMHTQKLTLSADLEELEKFDFKPKTARTARERAPSNRSMRKLHYINTSGSITIKPLGLSQAKPLEIKEFGEHLFNLDLVDQLIE